MSDRINEFPKGGVAKANKIYKIQASNAVCFPIEMRTFFEYALRRK
jgi:hypothetical protein